MRELEPTVIMKRSATVVDSRPVLTLTAPYLRKADLIAEVNRQVRRGEVRPIDARARWNDQAGLWEQRVYRLREPSPNWLRSTVMIVLALSVLGLLVALARWVLISLAAAPLALFLLAALAALMVLVRAGKRQTVTIINNVSQR